MNAITQREHLSKILQMLSPVSPDRFVPFERQICVSCYKYRLIFLDPLAENLRCRKFSEIFLYFLNLLCVAKLMVIAFNQNSKRVTKDILFSFLFFSKLSLVHPWHDRFWILLFNLHTVTAFPSLIPY